MKTDSNFQKLYTEFNDYKCNYKDNCKKTNTCKCEDSDNNKCSDNVFSPICNNAICNVPRMDIVTMIAEGHGTISENPEENDSKSKIAFKFFIGKKYSSYVGNLCLVNYDDEIFITSDKIYV